jgi:hypothetical protein
VLRRGRDARRHYRRKALRIGKAHAFHEAPAEPVLAASEPQRGNRVTPAQANEKRRRRQGCQRRTDSTRARRKKTPSRTIDRAPKWETRREARFSPVSFASGGPEPPGACSARLRTGGGAREEDVREDEHGAARLRDESDPRAIAERHRTGFGHCAGKRRSTSARVGTVSECRNRSDASPVATPVGATKRTSDTRDLARRNRHHPTRWRRRQRAKTVRGPSKRLLTTETRTGPSRTRKPRRDRIRRGAGSGTREVLGPRARGSRYDGRVSGAWMRPPKPGASLRLWPRG